MQQKNSDENKEFTIEVLVAVDKKMKEYHGENLMNYVLTLMSVVSMSCSVTVIPVKDCRFYFLAKSRCGN